MIFTWKGTPTRSVYASNARPEMNTLGPYPSRAQNEPQTTTELRLRPYSIDKPYYDPVQKSVTFEKVTCTGISTSLPTVCLKKLPRPLKIWRKRLNPDGPTKTKVTLNQVFGLGTSVTENPVHCIQTDIPKVMSVVHIRRSGGRPKTCDGQLPQKACMSTREYLQKRGRTFDQNQAQGQKVATYTYESGQASKDPDHCTQITVKPSNQGFKVQGGVSASARTNHLKYETVQSNVAQANYATARATLDTGYVNVKSQNQVHNECASVLQDRAHIRSCAYVKR
jgi:hypothetical protein